MITLPDEVFEGGGRLRMRSDSRLNSSRLFLFSAGKRAPVDVTKIVNLLILPWIWARRAFLRKKNIAFSQGSIDESLGLLMEEIGKGNTLVLHPSGNISIEMSLLDEKPLKKKVFDELKARLSEADECVVLIENKYVGFAVETESLEDGSIRFHAIDRYIQSELSTPFTRSSLTPS